MIIRGKSVTATAPLAAAIITDVTTTPAVSSPFPAKPIISADKAISAIVDPSGTSSTGPVSVAHAAALVTATGPVATKYAPSILASKEKSAIPDFSHYTSASDLSTTLGDLRIEITDRKHKNFAALGDMSGMSNQRPVIVAVTNFEPVMERGISRDAVTTDSPLTRMGKHLFEQFFVRLLISENITRLIKDMQKDSASAQQIGILTNQFQSNFQTGFAPVTELFEALYDIELLKKSFEFKRYDTYNSAAFESLVRLGTLEALITRDVTSVKISDLFTSDYHFNEKSFREFTNTKVLFQLIYELQHVIKNHSYDLIRFDVTNHTSDTSQTLLVKNTTVSTKYVNGFLERFKKLKLTNEQLQGLYNSSDIEGIIKVVSKNVELVGVELPTNLIDRISLLSSLICREVRVSSGMANTDFRNRLKTYGFDPDSDINLIDQLVGDIPNNVTDVLNAQSKASLSNLLQITDGSSAILPFEQKYIESENGTYTPGSVYLADAILDDPTNKFDTTRLQRYYDSAITATTALTDVMNQLHLINPAKHSPVGANRSDVFFIRMLAEVMRSSTSNGDLSAGILVGTQNEVLIASLAQAVTDDQLKSLLFALFTADSFEAPRVTSESSTAIVLLPDVLFETTLIQKISARVSTLLNAHRSATTSTVSDYKRPTDFASGAGHVDISTFAPIGGASIVNRDIGDEEFRAAFSSTEFDNMKNFFVSITNEFSNADCYDSLNRTRFSKVNSEAIKIIVFELIVDLVARFTSPRFVLSAAGNLQTQNDTIKAENFRILIDKLVVAPDMQKALQSILAEEADRFDPQLRIIGRKLNDEEIAVKKAYLAVCGAVVGVTSKASEILSLFASDGGKYSRVFSDISSFVKPEFMQFIDSAQIRLALHQAYTTQQYTAVADSGHPIQFLDGSVVNKESVFALSALMSEKQFQSDAAENLRILTVGLPAGFSRHLQERISLKDVKDNPSLVTKQKDIVRFTVYKRDLEFPDLVFIPQTFLFELSRFISPVNSFKDTLLPDNPSFGNFSQVLENVRTFDMARDSSLNRDASAWAKGKFSDIYTSDQYDFLTDDQRDEIIENHTVSYLLETYVRLLTGVSLNEQAFLLNSGDEITLTTLPDQTVIKALIDDRVKSIGKLDSFDSSVDSVDSLDLPEETRNKLLHDLKHISALAFSRTTLSNPSGEIRRTLNPKLFERVFNIAVDPDDFVIDQTRTTSTLFGDSALHKLLSTGEVTVISPTTSALGSVSDVTYKLSEKNRKRGTVTLEQYFVTVETVLGTEV